MTMGAHNGKQLLAAFVVNLYSLAYGIFIAWNEIDQKNHFDKIPVFEANSLEFQEFERNGRKALIRLFVGPFFGSIFFGYIAMKYGRKTSLLCTSIPMIVSVFIYLFVHDLAAFEIATALSGFFGGGVSVVGPLYLIEIVKDRYRGAIISSMFLAEILGEVLAFGGDSLMKNKVVVWVGIVSIAVASTIFYRYLPDTPFSLIKRKKFAEAEHSIKTFKNIRETDANYADTLKKELDRIKNVVTDSDLEANRMNSLRWHIRWADFKTKHMQKALAIVIVLGVLSVCSCSAHIMSRTMRKLMWCPISYDSSRLIVSIVALVGAYAAMQTVDRIGRKVLITVSGVATSVAIISDIAFAEIVHPAYADTSSNLIAAITSLMAIFFGALGIRSLTLTICSEILNDKIKDAGVIFCGAFFWFFSYIFHVVFYSARSEPVALLISAILCLIGSIAMHFMLPETKGKSYQEIMKINGCI